MSISRFYQTYSNWILLLVAVTAPYFYFLTQTVSSNNDIETWLPKDSQVKAVYDQFKADFGAEEFILVGLDEASEDPALLEAMADRIVRLETVRHCWSPGRLTKTMTELSVPEEEINLRLIGLVKAENSEFAGLLVIPSELGIKDRARFVDEIEAELEYCQIPADQYSLAGSPVLTAELDRLGGYESSEFFFRMTLMVCASLLYYYLRDIRLTLVLLGITVWGITVTNAAVQLTGNEMNFILGALSVMVMIFTLANCIHFLHYYTSLEGDDEQIGRALIRAAKPCSLATLTTTIGLISLSVSNILPVRQFGYFAAFGCVVAMYVGIFLTPAAIVLCPIQRLTDHSGSRFFAWVGRIIIHNNRPTIAVSAVLTLIAGFGLVWTHTHIEPTDFLSPRSKVISDLRKVEKELAGIDSIEAVVDFKDADIPFVEKLNRIRELEAVIREHKHVRLTVSQGTFFPTVLPDAPLELASLLKRAKEQKQTSDYMTSDERLWRISARIEIIPMEEQQAIITDLKEATAGQPIYFTGLAPLLKQAQNDIFNGFWESFALAFAIITGIMVFTLRSWKIALLAMIPNFTPIAIVFGILGWFSIPVDVGMMMTASIALGIAVDGTFHLVVHFEKCFDQHGNGKNAALEAFMQTGAPITKAAIISSIGMMALTMSSFEPTSRFGILMATLLLAALIGDLVMLPALLSLWRNRQPSQTSTGQETIGNVESDVELLESASQQTRVAAIRA